MMSMYKPYVSEKDTSADYQDQGVLNEPVSQCCERPGDCCLPCRTCSGTTDATAGSTTEV